MNNEIHENDGNFNADNCLNYQLLLEVGANYYTYAIVDEQGKLKLVCTKNLPLSQILNDNDLLKRYFRQIKISLTTHNFTFIPASFYNPNQKNIYYPFFDSAAITTVFTYSIMQQQITVLNTFNQQQLHILKQNFPLANIYPQYLPFLESTFSQFKAILGIQLFLNFKLESLELLIMQDGKLLFYNIFNCFNNDEVLYHTLVACKQNNVNPQNVTLRLCGNITLNTASYQQLNTIFSDIRFTKTNAIYVNNAEFKTLEPHNFFSLLSLVICE